MSISEQTNNLHDELNSQDSNLAGRKKPRYLVPVIILVLLIITVGFAIAYKIVFDSKQNINKVEDIKIDKKIERATRIYFKDSKPIQTLKEENIKNPDGTLETIIRQGSEKLSHQVFLKNMILSLNNGMLTIQKFKKPVPNLRYESSGDNFLNLIRSNPNAVKEKRVVGQNTFDVYSIGGVDKNSFNIVKNAYADTTEQITKIFLDSESHELVKVEILENSGNEITETIEYEEGPELDEIILDTDTDKSTEEADINETEPVISETITEQPNRIGTETGSITPEPTLESTPGSKSGEVTPIPENPEDVLKKEAKDIKEIIIDPPTPVSTTSAITLYPTTAIITSDGYTNLYTDIHSSIFGLRDLYSKELHENGAVNPDAFAEKYVKVKIDGIDLDNVESFVTVDIRQFQSSDNPEEIIRFKTPLGLQPGYHTMQVYAIDTLYIVPSLMVIMPPVDEDLVEFELSRDVPPMPTVLPNNKGFGLALTGKNLSKPLKITLTNTQGKRFYVEDSWIDDSDPSILKISLPQYFGGEIYSLSIEKDGQTIYRPNYLLISDNPPIIPSPQ